ncbi:MAG TPA: NAD-binding protein [Longimicrobiales bacterium]|nr:NAD-binding protein [Longimicrobiales bacterium]
MPSSSPRWQRRLVAAAFLLGVAVLLLAFVGLFREGGYRVGLELSADGLRAFSTLIFQTAATLWLGQPQPPPTDLAFTWARILAVLFALSAGVGILLELYRPASDAALRTLFWWSRAVRPSRPPAVVIGLGSVGGPLARELRRKGRPVYAIEPEEGGARAAEARRAGALVLRGDGMDPGVRRRAALRHASEVFVATGDDERNVQIAAAVLGELEAPGARRRPGRGGGGGRGAAGSGPEAAVRATGGRRPCCYVHAADPTLASTLRGHELLRRRAGAMELRAFSIRDLAARDLFFSGTHGLLRSPASVPRTDEVFHLFLFGFGALGQTIALHLARFGHFASGLRPRLTVYGDFASPSGERARRAFLERYAAFCPDGLDLAGPAFLAARDAWVARPGRPSAADHRSPEVVSVRRDGRSFQVRPVEYVVNAEFRALPSALEAASFLGEVEARLGPPQGPRVRAALVVCIDDRPGLLPALRLQQALAHRLRDDPAGRSAEIAATVPIYFWLPVDEGVARLVAEQEAAPDASEREAARRFPLRPFGGAVGSYEAITQGRLRDQALGLRAVYGIVARRPGDGHLDFEDSNIDAVDHAEAVKLPALGIRFLRERELDAAEAVRRHVWPDPLLGSLCGAEAVAAQRALEAAVPKDPKSGKLVLEPQAFEALGPSLRQRLAVLDRVLVPESPKERAETPEERARRERLELAVAAALGQAIRILAAELAERGRDADLAARTEHARWMGERLVKGWRFGARREDGRRRETFVPWEDLADADRDYDRTQVPRRIVEHALEEEYAYVALPDSAPGPA